MGTRADENSAAYKRTGWVVFAGTFLVPGGGELKTAETGLVKALDISEHAVIRAGERGFSEAMIKAVIRKGEKFYDPANGSINYVIRRGFASGKDALVAVNALTGRVNTVIRGSKLVRPRFIPIQ